MFSESNTQIVCFINTSAFEALCFSIDALWWLPPFFWQWD